MKASAKITPWTREHDDYLHDESRLIGTAESISFPGSEAEIVEVIREIGFHNTTITTQGARTGIVGGAVPCGGLVLNLSRMKRITEPCDSSITVEPGVILSDLRQVLERKGLFFPPDPTETTCSIGGMVACNASGALTFHYGSTRDWVTALRVVLSDGDILTLRRSENYARGRSFSLKTEGGRIISGSLPSYTFPKVKSVAGYYVESNMDMLDLFIGMEGTLGIISEITLRLISKPEAINGLMIFFPEEESAIKAVRILRGEKLPGYCDLGTLPVAIEFFNHDALILLRNMKSESSAFEKIPALKPHYHTAVYIEFHERSNDACEEAVLAAMEAIAALGISEDDTWYATSDREIEPLKSFRHAVPEAVNMLIDRKRIEYPGITKLGTDMSVPSERLEQALEMYNNGLSKNGLDSVMFGHIGNNHIHVNILPRNPEEYQRGKNLYLEWAHQIVEWGGSVAAEHGIGKLKTGFLELMYGAQGIAEMRALKRIFDPAGILNPGNLFKLEGN